MIDDIVGAIETLGIPSATRERILKKAFAYLEKNFTLKSYPSKFITELHRIIKKELNLSIPFYEQRMICNQLGVKLAKNIEREYKKIRDEKRALGFLLHWAVAGNHLDFRTAGKGYGINLSIIRRELKKIAEGRFAVDETEEAFKFIKKTKTILFIHDNVGEIAIDGVLIKALKKLGKNVTSALRGGAITSDASLSDGLAVGLEKIAHRIVVAGPDTLGVSWEEATKEFKRILKESDLIISKGQANFYVLTEHLEEIPPVLFLLTTKCDYASGYFGFNGKGAVIKLIT